VSDRQTDFELWDKLNEIAVGTYEIDASLAVLELEKSAEVLDRLNVTDRRTAVYIQSKRAYSVPIPKSVDQGASWLKHP
jgi:hypothetical protein